MRKPSAHQVALVIAILLVCVIAIFALAQFMKARDLTSKKGSDAASAQIERLESSESPQRRRQRLQDMLQSEDEAQGAAQSDAITESYFAGLGVQPGKKVKDFVTGQYRYEYAPAQTESAAVLNIRELRAALENTELDIDQIYYETAAQLGIADAPLLNAPGAYTPASAANVSAEARLYDLLADFKRFTILTYAAAIMPLGVPITAAGTRFSSGYGPRVHPITGVSKMHAGADFAAPTGAPVVATGGGVVVYAGVRGGYGNTIQIRHEFGLETTYAHLHHIRVAEGDRVEREAWIADMGSTGASTGSHLHYEVRLNGEHLDPIKFIRAGRDAYQE